jgi:hypothetical protein
VLVLILAICERVGSVRPGLLRVGTNAVAFPARRAVEVFFFKRTAGSALVEEDLDIVVLLLDNTIVECTTAFVAARSQIFTSLTELVFVLVLEEVAIALGSALIGKSKLIELAVSTRGEGTVLEGWFSLMGVALLSSCGGSFCCKPGDGSGDLALENSRTGGSRNGRRVGTSAVADSFSRRTFWGAVSTRKRVGLIGAFGGRRGGSLSSRG